MNRGERQQHGKQQAAEGRKEQSRPVKRWWFRGGWWENNWGSRRRIANLPLVKQNPNHVTDDQNWNRDDEKFDCADQDCAPLPFRVLGVRQDACLQNKELGWYQNKKDECDQYLPNSCHACRHEKIKRSEEQGIENDEQRQTADVS